MTRLRAGIPGRTDGNQSTEISSLNEISRKLNELKLITAAVAASAGGDASLAEQQSQTALLTTMDTNIADIEVILANVQSLLAKSNLYKMQTEANDLVETYTWLDGGAADQRINTIVYSSAALALSVTETFTYNGGAGTYHVATSTLS